MYRSISVALVSNEEASGFTTPHAQLTWMGYAPALFATAGDLLSALAAGCRFNLLVLMLRSESRPDGLLCVCGVLGIPVLLIVQNPLSGCDLLSLNDGFVHSHIVALPASRLSTEALDEGIQTLLQPTGIAQHAAKPDGLVWGDYRFAADGSLRVRHRSRDVRLQPRQFAFAVALFQNMGRVLTRDELLASVWGGNPNGTTARPIDVCAANLRRKLALCSENGFVLRSVYGKGYSLIAVRPLPDGVDGDARAARAHFPGSHA
ncbi:winged helix-turn-helix domain-containing protein [Variovorax sp. GB1P17]|uniref:winged helix-turn-helix domain-containing protein n=1 Tax=Variovorax sp. GB1P17 TaxID=3443740 RepID=UPI003F479E86